MTADTVTWLFFTLLLASVMVSIAGARLEGVHSDERLLEMRILLDDVAEAVNLATAGGPGHEVVVELPERLNHTDDYRVLVNSSGVYGWADGQRAFSSIYPVVVADGYGRTRVYLESGGRYSIRNTPRNNRTVIMISGAS
ncbi:MAG: hypothetical protein Kow0021_16370 [Methanothermobacter thermautotrophicus]